MKICLNIGTGTVNGTMHPFTGLTGRLKTSAYLFAIDRRQASVI